MLTSSCSVPITNNSLFLSLIHLFKFDSCYVPSTVLGLCRQLIEFLSTFITVDLRASKVQFQSLPL